MNPLLRQGSKGDAVIELQRLLQGQGFYNGKLDGDFGSGTANAVINFQKAHGLTADGIFGNVSWTKLRSLNSAPAMPTLLQGAKGTYVMQAQQLLKDKGYYQGRIDGDFGNGTKTAIAAFQKANGLVTDGKVGAKTWGKLLAPAIAATPAPSNAVNEVAPTFVEIVRPEPTTTSTPTEPIATQPPLGSIFVPAPAAAPIPNPVTSAESNPIISPVSNPESNPVNLANDIAMETPAIATPDTIDLDPLNHAISDNAISLVDAANVYSRAQLPHQTEAIDKLQSNIEPAIFQQFMQRWFVSTGSISDTSSLSAAFSGYNAIQMANQNLSLQWLQSQLSPEALTQFRQDWSNQSVSIGITTGTPFTALQPDATPSAPNPVNLISLTEAIKTYHRASSQVKALEQLQNAIESTTMQQFFQRWTVASGQTAIAISLLDVFQDYDPQKYPSQITALQWLEKELVFNQIEQFSKIWFA
jgi:peptidoglycan hydrolase-like protein with peptidoglycan-binding domain